MRRDDEPDVVETAAEAAALSRPPLLILDRIRGFLDEHGLGEGLVAASRIGAGGGSNFSFLLERGVDRYVLRRPPRPPLPPSAHDVVREARLQLGPRAARDSRPKASAPSVRTLACSGSLSTSLITSRASSSPSELPPGLDGNEARAPVVSEKT